MNEFDVSQLQKSLGRKARILGDFNSMKPFIVLQIIEYLLYLLEVRVRVSGGPGNIDSLRISRHLRSLVTELDDIYEFLDNQSYQQQEPSVRNQHIEVHSSSDYDLTP